MHFCGPGTRLDVRLNEDGTPKADSMPVDRIDEAALRHDIFYASHTGTRERLRADKQMIDEVNSIDNPTGRDCFERAIVTFALHLKGIVVRFVLTLLNGFRGGPPI